MAGVSVADELLEFLFEGDPGCGTLGELAFEDGGGGLVLRRPRTHAREPPDEGDGLVSVACVDFLEDPMHVALDGRETQAELDRDLSVRRTFLDESEDLAFSFGEALEHRIRGTSVRPAPADV